MDDIKCKYKLDKIREYLSVPLADADRVSERAESFATEALLMTLEDVERRMTSGQSAIDAIRLIRERVILRGRLDFPINRWSYLSPSEISMKLAEEMWPDGYTVDRHDAIVADVEADDASGGCWPLGPR